MVFGVFYLNPCLSVERVLFHNRNIQQSWRRQAILFEKVSVSLAVKNHKQEKPPALPKPCPPWGFQIWWRSMMGQECKTNREINKKSPQKPAEREHSVQTTSCMKGQRKKFIIKVKNTATFRQEFTLSMNRCLSFNSKHLLNKFQKVYNEAPVIIMF